MPVGLNPDAPPGAPADASTVADMSKDRILETRFKIEGINLDGDDGKPQVSLSEAFGKLAGLLEREVIKDFALTRTTMGEVFTNFAKFQIDAAAEGEDKDKKDKKKK